MTINKFEKRIKDSIKEPLTHAERGRLGGLKKGVKKGFAANPELAAEQGRKRKKVDKPN